jgi:hypothetical protein
MNAGTILSTDQSPSTSDETNEMGDIPYQRGIRLLMYAATSTCPDITFPITILSQFMWNLGQIHWEAVKDVIRYLKGMADLTLTLPKGYGRFNSDARRIRQRPQSIC